MLFFIFMEAEIKADDGRSISKGYFVDEAEAEEFDKQFPPKEKLKLPGQIFG